MNDRDDINLIRKRAQYWLEGKFDSTTTSQLAMDVLHLTSRITKLEAENERLRLKYAAQTEHAAALGLDVTEARAALAEANRCLAALGVKPYPRQTPETERTNQ